MCGVCWFVLAPLLVAGPDLSSLNVAGWMVLIVFVRDGGHYRRGQRLRLAVVEAQPDNAVLVSAPLLLFFYCHDIIWGHSQAVERAKAAVGCFGGTARLFWGHSQTVRYSSQPPFTFFYCHGIL